MIVLRVWLASIPTDFVFEQSVIRIGRQTTHDIVISHATVSRNHACIQLNSDGQYIIFDDSSSCGIYVNNIRTVRAVLHINDQVQIGLIQMLCVAINPQ